MEPDLLHIFSTKDWITRIEKLFLNKYRKLTTIEKKALDITIPTVEGLLLTLLKQAIINVAIKGIAPGHELPVRLR